MAVLVTLDVPGGTTAQYDRALQLVGLADNDAPAGLVSHACAVTGDGIVVADVWESEASFDEFVRDRLGAALAGSGMPEPVRQVTPVHDLIFGRGEQPNVLVLLQAPGLTTGDYDAIVAKMPSHDGNGESHPAVVHAAASDPDGFRIADLYDSEAAYQEFAQNEMLPAIGDPRHFVLRVWPVHRSLLPQRHATG
jgi:hypothetical protein